MILILTDQESKIINYNYNFDYAHQRSPVVAFPVQHSRDTLVTRKLIWECHCWLHSLLPNIYSLTSRELHRDGPTGTINCNAAF
jgi:hypothetical protein